MNSYKRIGLGTVFLFATVVTASAAPACCGGEAANHPGPPGESGKTEEEKGFGLYEKISAALVADDLEAAQAAAGKAAELAAEKGVERAAELAEAVAESEDLDAAREAFVPLSREVIKLTAGRDGYYVMSCPMVENGQWLQSDDAVRNPYMGQSMPACGGVEMATAEIELAGCCEDRRACCDNGGDCCPV